MSKAMLQTMTGFYDRTHIDDAAAARTIAVDTGMVRVTDFNLDRDTQDLLFRKDARRPRSSWTARRYNLPGTGRATNALTEAGQSAA
jgi:hypothetical protein